MIHSIEIENFKNIRHQKIDLERLTVFVGPNGCGKTSVLQAIDEAVWWVRKEFEEYSEEILLRKGTALSWLQSKGANMNIDLKYTTSLGEYDVTLIPLPYEDRSSSEPDVIRWVHEIGFPRTPVNPEELSENNQIVTNLRFVRLDASKLSAASYSESSFPQISSDGSGLPSVLAYMALNDPDGFDSLVDELRSLIPQVRRIRFTKLPVEREEVEIVRFGNESVERRMKREFQGDSILFDLENAKGVMAQTASEGTLLLLGYLTILLGPHAPDVLLLDDIEKGLHPLAQQRLLETLTKIMGRFPNLQIIATAHSPYLLDCLQPEQVRMMTLGADGYAICGKLTDHPEFDKWKDEMAPGELWSLFGEKWITGAGVSP